MKPLFSIGIILFFCGCSAHSDCEQKVQKLEMELSSLKTKSTTQVIDQNSETREKTIERFENGSKKLVVTYNGTGSNEQVISKVSYYPNGETKEIENYINNELNGPYLEYYRNGEVSVSCTYLKGQRHGNFVEYYFDGEIWETGKFFEGDYDGEYITYFANGNMKSYEHYNKGDRIEAVWYNLNGEVEFKN